MRYCFSPQALQSLARDIADEIGARLRVHPATQDDIRRIVLAHIYACSDAYNAQIEAERRLAKELKPE